MRVNVKSQSVAFLEKDCCLLSNVVFLIACALVRFIDIENLKNRSAFHDNEILLNTI